MSWYAAAFWHVAPPRPDEVGRTMTPRRTSIAIGLVPVGLAILIGPLLPSARIAADDQPDVDPAAVEFFETSVRPLLISRCYECHGPDSKGEGGLRLDSRAAALRGGDSGPAIVPGQPDESLLIDAVRYGDIFQMPPQSKLPEDEINTLTAWVRQGAPWPGDDLATRPDGDGHTDFSEEEKSFWAFQPPREPAVPPVRRGDWPQSPLDHFILAGLEAQGLSPAPAADRRTLIRRATFDLIGLPPTPEEVEAFLADQSSDAFAHVVDRLLASPRYGERWGRHWLDVARYADSNGMDENLAFANAYRYRDYVVRAFNRDLPFDQFIRQQLAGDLLPPAGDDGDLERIVATGFLTLGAKMLAEDDPVKMEMDIIDEQVDTIGRAFLGLTFGCARCHDHKFDPILAEDYYALAGIFKSTKTMENFSVVAVWNERPLATRDQLAQIEALRAQIASVQGQIDSLSRDANQTLLATARPLAAEYLLTAAWLERLTDPARSLMAGAQGGQTPGTIVIEAEAFARGNALIQTTGYGEGIGVILNAGPLPNVAEYDIDVPAAGTYQIEIRYAAADARPVQLSCNGQVLKADAAGRVTGSWYPDTQAWHVEGVFPLAAGPNVIRLECAGPFPHLDRLALIPRELPEGVSLASIPLDEVTAGQASNDGHPQLNPGFLAQWRKLYIGQRAEPTSIAHALELWERITAGESVAIDPSTSPAAAAILADPRPMTAAELLARYRQLFAQAEDAWQALTQTDEGATATALNDAALEPFRLALFDPQGPLAVPEKAEAYYPADVAAQIAARREERSALEAQLPAVGSAMAVEERPATDLPVHIRGNHLTLGKSPIPRGFPRIIAGESPPAIDTAASGRLQLADWLTRPENPLTARVMVNRVWRGHFGHGLVRSVDNFGRLGERPTHPELLDWLALRFIDDGWSLKALHRRLMLTATYQMSTTFDERAAAADPENRLHWRADRRRMEAEAVRDSILAVSGRLDPAMEGSLLASKNREYVAGTASVNTANYETSRRSIYLPVVRSALYEVFQAFDFADPSTQNGNRDTTTVAPQALFMMNSRLMLDESRALAQRLLDDAALDGAALDGAALDDAGRVATVYLRCYARPPSAAEQARALAFVDRYRQAAAGEPLPEGGTLEAGELNVRAWQALCRVLLSANEFIYIE
jgi:mono/diheme cytochrome c family protein